MKKRTLILLTVVLTLIFVTFTTSVAFAAEGEEVAEFTKADMIKTIVIYCIFGLSILVGIPAIRAINKRKKSGYVEHIVSETKSISEKLHSLYENRNSNSAKREIIKYSFKISAVADMALTTYTEKHITGYYDVFNSLNSLRTLLSTFDKIKDETKYESEFSNAIKLADEIAEKSTLLAKNEDIIKRYNK